ncbi:hypothetical protein [Stakelama saccharophila]|uniref:Lipoprotein n=1 Tax=Stakelama saccharophila TaxID=3075605 RepID=A0ABZ0B6E6_9SPHN|nr:hypothetical protein [Stakelama sp. W311]WNO52817.1 hypothetical protein RPR59_10135 [Stakelama sp. W311]
MKRGWPIALVALAACSGGGGTAGKNRSNEPPGLEQAAIARGVIRDPEDSGIEGLYARDTDRLCLVRRADGYRIGVFVDYGTVQCSGTGRASRSGEALHVELGGRGACSFDARADGEHVVLPGDLPNGCDAYCGGRASLTGLDVSRLSESRSEAAALRDDRGRPLCPTAARAGKD